MSRYRYKAAHVDVKNGTHIIMFALYFSFDLFVGGFRLWAILDILI